MKMMMKKLKSLKWGIIKCEKNENDEKMEIS